MPTTRPLAVTAAVAIATVSSIGLHGCADTGSPTQRPSSSSSRTATDLGATDLARRFVTTFNDGDARALADLFTDDAEFVNIYGIRMSGRTGIERGHEAAFASRLDGATLSAHDVEQHAAADGVAVVQVGWRLERAADADPALAVPDSAGVLTFTALRTDGAWLFVAGANVVTSPPPS